MAVVYRYIGILRVGVLCEPLQRTHLQQPLLRMSPTAGDETSRGRTPENGRRRDFGRRRRHRQSGIQHTYRPQPSSPELFNKDHNAGRESLSHLIKNHIYLLEWWLKNPVLNLSHNKHLYYKKSMLNHSQSFHRRVGWKVMETVRHFWHCFIHRVKYCPLFPNVWKASHHQRLHLCCCSILTAL